MNVAELIAELKKMPWDAEVVIDGLNIDEMEITLEEGVVRIDIF